MPTKYDYQENFGRFQIRVRDRLTVEKRFFGNVYFRPFKLRKSDCKNTIPLLQESRYSTLKQATTTLKSKLRHLVNMALADLNAGDAE